jgi:hypothetical protein
VLYGIALVVGVREYVVARASPEAAGPSGCEASAASCFSAPSRATPLSDTAVWAPQKRMVQVVAEVNPDDATTDFLRGMRALAEGDEGEFARRLEKAIGSGAKHDRLLLQYYAQLLFDRGDDFQAVNRAVNRWRENHPYSPERFTMYMSMGPATPADDAALREAFASVPWIGSVVLEPYMEGEVRQWRLHIGFKPGRPVDLREAVAAATVLALSPEQRALYEVTCETLDHCRPTLRNR